MFFDEYSSRKGLSVIVIGHGHCGLQDDGSGIGSLVNEMDGTSAEANTVAACLSLRIETGKGW